MRDFNFFSPYLEYKKKSTKKVFHTVIIVLIIIIPTFGIYSYNQYKITKLENRLSALQDSMTSNERVEGIKKYKEVEKKLEVLKQYFTALNNVNDKINRLDVINSELFNKLESVFPKTVFIRNLSVTTNEIQMQGVSKDKIAVAELQHNLKELKIFDKVHVSIITNESDEGSNVIFAVLCTLKDVANDETE